MSREHPRYAAMNPPDGGPPPAEGQASLFGFEEAPRQARRLTGRPLGPLGADLDLQPPPDPTAQKQFEPEPPACPTSKPGQTGDPGDWPEPPPLDANPTRMTPDEIEEQAEEWRALWPGYAARCRERGKWPRQDWEPLALWREGYGPLAIGTLREWLVPWRPPGARYNHRLAKRHARKLRARKEQTK